MGASGNPAKKAAAKAVKKSSVPKPPAKSAKAPVPLAKKDPKKGKVNAKTKSTQRISNFRAK